MFRTTMILATIVVLLGVAPVARAARWEADPSHSRVGFSVRHMMISNVRGEFGAYTVSVDGDPKDVSKAKLEVIIQAKSIDTKNGKRDEHLRSPEFLDAGKFPTITFRSKKITKVGADGLKVLGALTIRNVTREATLEVSGLSAPIKDPWGMTRLGAQASVKINRKDFGLSWNKVLETGGLLVGNDIAIAIEVELVQKK